MQVRHRSLENPLEEGAQQPTPVFLPGESLRQSSLAGCSRVLHRVGQDCSDLAHMHAQLIKLVVQQKPTEHHKRIILQLKINFKREMKHLTSATGSSGQLIIWDYQLRRINKNEPQKKSLKIINKTYQGKNNQSMKGEGCCI